MAGDIEDELAIDRKNGRGCETEPSTRILGWPLRDEGRAFGTGAEAEESLKRDLEVEGHCISTDTT